LNHACPNARNNGPPFPELAANRKERRNGKIDAVDPGCVKTLGAIIGPQQTNPIYGLGESGGLCEVASAKPAACAAGQRDLA
jgi:hypothetical protein